MEIFDDIPIRIMIVDDEPQIGEFIRDFLQDKGYEAFYIDNGNDALKFVKRARPHIALLDIRMSGMDGLELLQKIHNLDPRIGAIMITALNEESIGKRALALGAVDYLIKPIDIEYLETSVSMKLSSMLE